MMMVMLLCMQPFNLYAVTLQEAMQASIKQHPMLDMAEQGVDVAQGNLIEESAYAYNPELSVEPQRRRLNAGGSSNDYYITLSQGIEVGPKRSLREQAAQAALNASRQAQKATQQKLMIEASRAFVALYFSDKLYHLRKQQSDMLEQVAHAMIRKVELGQSSQLDANLAQAIFSSAFQATSSAQQKLAQNRQRYSLALGQVEAIGDTLFLELPKLNKTWKPNTDAYQLALESRPDLAVLRAESEQSNAQADLASLARVPDITLSAMVGREAGDKLFTVGIAMPFPVLNSHSGAYRAALAEKELMNTGLAWSEKKLRYEVRAALLNHETAMAALDNIIQSDMQKNAKLTIELAQKAYDAGELDLEEWVVHIRQGLDARVTGLEITKQAWMARIRLAEVLGQAKYILEGIE